MTNGPNRWVRIAAVVILGCVGLSVKAQAALPATGEQLVPERSSCGFRQNPLPDPACDVAETDQPVKHLEMTNQGGCGCDFFNLSCWWNCVWGSSGGGGGTGGGGSSDPCVQCKDDARRALATCNANCVPLYVNALAHNDCDVECKDHLRNAMVDCSLPEGGPCNDTSYP